MTRRMQHYDVAAWHPWLVVAAVGAAVILAGIGCQVVQLVVSIRNRAALRDNHRRSLERPLAGMGHLVAAAGLQLRGACRMSRARMPTGA